MTWYRRFTNLLRSDRHSRDLDREMGFHLAERVDELIASGMPEAEARREARRRFGNRGVMKERTRDADILAWLDALFADIRQAARALRANRGFALVAVLSLGLGIGANTAIFSLINTVMLKSLPVRHPETLLKVTMGKDGGELHQSDLGTGARSSRAVRRRLCLQPEPVRPRPGRRSALGRRRVGERRLLRAPSAWRAILGRTIAREDDVRNCPAVAVISWGLWQNEFGGARSAIGKTLMVNSHPFTIVGVVDRAFFGMEVGRQTQIYAPICAAPTNGGIPTATRRACALVAEHRGPATGRRNGRADRCAPGGSRARGVCGDAATTMAPRRSGELPQAHADGGACGERLLGPAPGVRRARFAS